MWSEEFIHKIIMTNTLQCVINKIKNIGISEASKISERREMFIKSIEKRSKIITKHEILELAEKLGDY